MNTPQSPSTNPALARLMFPKRIVGWMRSEKAKMVIAFVKLKQRSNPGIVTKCQSKAYNDGQVYIDIRFKEIDEDTFKFFTSLNGRIDIEDAVVKTR